jgi:hypothetical protein
MSRVLNFGKFKITSETFDVYGNQLILMRLTFLSKLAQNLSHTQVYENVIDGLLWNLLTSKFFSGYKMTHVKYQINHWPYYSQGLSWKKHD